MWETHKLPDGKLFIPGVIAHKTTTIEPPELVAERLVRLGEHDGQRKHHRRRRLRSRRAMLPGDRLGEAEGAVGRRRAGFQAIVELEVCHARGRCIRFSSRSTIRTGP